jgi:hypothetical protein
MFSYYHYACVFFGAKCYMQQPSILDLYIEMWIAAHTFLLLVWLFSILITIFRMFRRVE